jgi:hypothetical protein
MDRNKLKGGVIMRKLIFTYMLAIPFCILFSLGIISSFFYSSAFNTEKYMKRIEKNDYEKTVLSTVYTQLDSIGDIISIDTDEIYNLLNKDDIVNHSKNYTRSYLNAILNGQNFSEESLTEYSISYARADLERLVQEFYETSTHSFSEEEFEIIYTYIEDQINSSLEFLSSNILEKTLPAGEIISVLKDIFGFLRFAFIPSGFFLLMILLLNLKEGIGNVIYKVGGVIFIPSTLFFIPTFLFDKYNLGSKIVLSKSPLSIVVKSALETVVKGFKTYTGIFFAISFVMIVAGAILTTIKKNKTKTEF